LVFKTLIKYLRLFFLLPQALVVLVHDMGPNWELISDAINSTVQFKVNKIISSIDNLLVWDGYQVTVQNIVYCLQCFIAGKNQFQFPFLYSSSFHLSDGEASLSLWFFFPGNFIYWHLPNLFSVYSASLKNAKIVTKS
jgi:hypothetical protein